MPVGLTLAQLFGPVAAATFVNLMLFALAGTGAVAADDPAGPPRPRDSAVFGQILRTLEAQNPTCTVALAYSGRLTTQRVEMPSHFDNAILAVFTVDGCGGGNNWLTAAQVYGVKDEAVRALGDGEGWLNVEGVDFTGDRAVIRALRQGPEDPHCCPTDGRTVEVTMDGDRPVFRQTGTWTGKAN